MALLTSFRITHIPYIPLPTRLHAPSALKIETIFLTPFSTAHHDGTCLFSPHVPSTYDHRSAPFATGFFSFLSAYLIPCMLRCLRWTAGGRHLSIITVASPFHHDCPGILFCHLSPMPRLGLIPSLSPPHCYYCIMLATSTLVLAIALPLCIVYYTA
jgi:hypothetical protein